MCSPDPPPTAHHTHFYRGGGGSGSSEGSGSPSFDEAILSAGGNNGYGNSNVPCVGSAPVAGSSKFDFVRSESPHSDAGYGTSYGSLSNGHQQRQQQQERYLERQQEDRELAEFLVKKFNTVTFGYSGTGKSDTPLNRLVL